MNNEEKLERVIKVFQGQIYNMNQAVTFDREDAFWLIRQAERVQELEEQRDRIWDLKHKYYNQSKDYKKALEEIIKEECSMGRKGMWAEEIASKALDKS